MEQFNYKNLLINKLMMRRKTLNILKNSRYLKYFEPRSRKQAWKKQSLRYPNFQLAKFFWFYLYNYVIYFFYFNNFIKQFNSFNKVFLVTNLSYNLKLFNPAKQLQLLINETCVNWYYKMQPTFLLKLAYSFFLKTSNNSFYYTSLTPSLQYPTLIQLTNYLLTEEFILIKVNLLFCKQHVIYKQIFYLINQFI